MHSVHLTTQAAKGGTSSQYTDLAAANDLNIIRIRPYLLFYVLTYFCCIHCVYHIYNYYSSPDSSSPNKKKAASNKPKGKDTKASKQKDKQANKTVCGFNCMLLIILIVLDAWLMFRHTIFTWLNVTP